MKLVVSRTLSLLALAVCSSLLTDYFGTSATFCGVRHGCDQVLFSSYGKLVGVPLPVIGLVAFGAFFGLTFLRAGLRFVGPSALLAGVAGFALFLIQAVALRRFCPFCLIIDMTAMLLAVCELALPARVHTPRPTSSEDDRAGHGGGNQRDWGWIWAIGAGMALLGPIAWGAFRPQPAVPAVVKAQWRPGIITIVEVTDFDCPHCRSNHSVLQRFLQEEVGAIRFVRFVYPLRHHAHAWDAARAHHAAGVQGRADAMAEALFRTDDLSKEGCESLARSLGLDIERYRTVVNDPATDRAIRDSVAWVDEAALEGLPLIWVQDQRLVGTQSQAGLKAAQRRAEFVLNRRHESGHGR